MSCPLWYSCVIAPVFRSFLSLVLFFFFFFNDTATTEIYTLSLHDALPISSAGVEDQAVDRVGDCVEGGSDEGDRKSTRLNSSHANISYAVFCLKKKKKTTEEPAGGGGLTEVSQRLSK